jgi:hypothetical protein
MARRWITSGALGVLAAGAVVAGITGSSLGMSAASASPSRPVVTAAVGQANAAKGSKLPVSVPAKMNGVGGTLSGSVSRFSSKSGHVLADLSFTRFTSKTGTVTALPHAIKASPRVTSAATANSCGILNLRLGPLHLNLLGLVVNLNRVHLTITAVPGAGNLLGNLLCAVVHLLDGPAPAASQAQLLNDVTGTLGILGRL